MKGLRIIKRMLAKIEKRFYDVDFQLSFFLI